MLLLINSSSVKKYGSSFTAHLCHSFSFLSANWTPRTLLGVTQVLITSSPTGVFAVGTCLVVADVGVAGISELSCVAGAGGSVDSTSSSRSVACFHVNCRQVFMRQGVKILVNPKPVRLLTNGA